MWDKITTCQYVWRCFLCYITLLGYFKARKQGRGKDNSNPGILWKFRQSCFSLWSCFIPFSNKVKVNLVGTGFLLGYSFYLLYKNSNGSIKVWSLNFTQFLRQKRVKSIRVIWCWLFLLLKEMHLHWKCHGEYPTTEYTTSQVFKLLMLLQAHLSIFEVERS